MDQITLFDTIRVIETKLLILLSYLGRRLYSVELYRINLVNPGDCREVLPREYKQPGATGHEVVFRFTRLLLHIKDGGWGKYAKFSHENL